MKNILIVLFAITTVALGAVCVLQARKVSEQKTQITLLRGETERQTRELADLQSSQNLVEQQRKELSDQTARLAAKLLARQRADGTVAPTTHAGAAPQAGDPKAGSDKNAFGQFFSKMMDDPETRKVIRAQQRMMMNQLYAPLIKQMNLTPEEAGQFKDLLADNMMKGAEKATSLFGDGSSTNWTEAMKHLAEEQKGFDEQLRGFLGETRYAQYKDYQETVGERTQLNQFRQQFGDGETPITDAQTERLLAFMKEEKKNVAAATGQPLPGEDHGPANLQAMLSGEGTEKFLQSQETINQRVYERARGVLSENQLAAFGRFQTNQLQMMRMGMNMARKFMSPEKAESAVTQAN